MVTPVSALRRAMVTSFTGYTVSIRHRPILLDTAKIWLPEADILCINELWVYTDSNYAGCELDREERIHERIRSVPKAHYPSSVRHGRVSL